MFCTNIALREFMLIFARFDKYVGFLLLTELGASKLQDWMLLIAVLQVRKNRCVVGDLHQLF